MLALYMNLTIFVIIINYLIEELIPRQNEKRLH